MTCLTVQPVCLYALMQAAKFPLRGLSVHPEKTLSVGEVTWQRSPSFFQELIRCGHQGMVKQLRQRTSEQKL